MISVVALDRLAHGLLGTQQCHAAASHNAFFHCSAGGVQGVFDASLLFLHFDFGGSANLDHCHAAGQLGHALLQLFTVVVAGRFFDLNANLLHAGFDVTSSASAVDDDRVFLAHFDALGLTQVGQRHLFERQAHFFSDDLAARQDGDVFQHGLAAVAEARSLDSHDLQDAADRVHDQRSQGFAFDFFGNDQQRTASLGDLLQHRQQVTDVADLLVEQQHEGVVQQRRLLLGVVDEVGRQVAAVELHAFDDVEFAVQRLAVFHGDHAFLADLVHRVSDELADGFVAVGRDGADLRDFLGGGGGLRSLLQLGDQGRDSLVDAALQVHRVHAGSHQLETFANDGLCQDRGGRGAVTSVVAGLGGHFLHELGAHVLQLVLEFDFLGHGHTVLGHGGGAERTLEHHVAALGAQGHFDCVGQDVDTLDHACAGFAAEDYVFCCHDELTPNGLNLDGIEREEKNYFSTTANRSSSFITSSSSPSTLTVWPLYLPNRTRSPTLTVSAASSPLSLRLPGPTARTSP
ncbi:hypothetical protein D9M72_373830 [compost metagenome]